MHTLLTIEQYPFSIHYNSLILLFFYDIIKSPTLLFFFFFNNPPPPKISPLPLHDALPIFSNNPRWPSKRSANFWDQTAPRGDRHRRFQVPAADHQLFHSRFRQHRPSDKVSRWFLSEPRQTRFLARSVRSPGSPARCCLADLCLIVAMSCRRRWI